MQAVIFDVDGTLVDSVDLHAQAWRDAFLEFGHDIPFEVLRSQIGKGADQLLPALLPPHALADHAEALEERRGHIFREKYLDQVRGFPRVRELFERVLAEGLRIALASSAKGEELQTYKERADIADLLDAETSSNDAEKSKPHPDIFEAALDRLKIAPAQALVVGDSPYDAQAATKAGIASVGLLCGGFPRWELKAAGFLALYASPADLLLNFEHTPLARRRAA